MIIGSTFKPHPLIKNPHLQTLFASKLRRVRLPALENERLELPDGDFVDLALHLKNHGPLVCIFHGLQGCVRSTYASAIISHLLNVGYRIAFMHFRGCSGEPNRLASSYHSGHTDDIRYLLKVLSQRFPSTPIFAIGYSLGGNALLKYLGEESHQAIPVKAIAISPPLVLSEGAQRMNQGLSRIYQLYLVRQMQASLANKRALYPHLNLPIDTHQYKSFWEFDDQVTAPLNGFADVHDYYERSSSRPWLKHIQIPTHIIFAEDDPFFTRKCIPFESELSNHVRFELSDNGGHVGFIECGKSGSLSYWLEPRITQLLSQS